MNWRALAGADLPAVYRIADEIYPPHLHEPDEALRARANMGFGYCHVLEDRREIVGYLIAHPWDLTVPTFGKPLPKPGAYRTVFLHDLAILPAYRRHHLGFEAVRRVQEVGGKSHGSVRLISVNGSVPFWTACGFRALVEDTIGVDTYGTGAVLMRWQP